MDTETRGIIENIQKRLTAAENKISSLEGQVTSGSFVKYEDVVGFKNTHANSVPAPNGEGAWVRHYDRNLKIAAVGTSEETHFETDKRFKIKKI